MRNDKGALWENYLVSERLKVLHYRGIHCNRYFWRTAQQQELDYIEERNGILNAYEFRWSEKKKAKPSLTFTNAYPGHTFTVINKRNYLDFVFPGE